jgi:hypothetical protein
MIGTTIPVEQTQAVGDMLLAVVVVGGMILISALGWAIWLVKRRLDKVTLERH